MSWEGMMTRCLFCIIKIYITVCHPYPECEDQKLDVIFVVDKSKSIQDPELTHARQAVRGFIKPLHIGEY